VRKILSLLGLVIFAGCDRSGPHRNEGTTVDAPAAGPVPAVAPASKTAPPPPTNCPTLAAEDALAGGAITPVAGFVPTEASIVGRWLPVDNDAGTVITDAGFTVFSADGHFVNLTPNDPGVDTVRGSFRWNADCQQVDLTYTFGGPQLDTWHQESPNAIRRIRSKDIASGAEISDGQLWIRSGSAEYSRLRRISQGPLPPLPDATPKAWIDPMKLQRGRRYRLAKETPLMPALDPVDPIAALADMKQLAEGTVISVVTMRRNPTNPWYFVTVGTSSGWINSGALIGQSLTRAP
jgi:hypothetical protein